MLRGDSVKPLLADVRNHAIDRRAFLNRAAALGMSASAAAVLGAAGVAVPAVLAVAASPETGGTVEHHLPRYHHCYLRARR